jgi:anti-sigma regulatory factor (Ser/Thr protein kinase)
VSTTIGGYSSGVSDGDLSPPLAVAEFDPVPESVARARELVRNLAEVGDASDTVVLIVSELATNAVRHARTRFRVAVHRRSDVLRVEVADSGSGVPLLRRPEPMDTGGRGLFIVETLAARWGVDPAPGGKTVWAELPRASP